MENGTTHSTGLRAALIVHTPKDPATKYDRILDLFREVSHHEMSLKKSMAELESVLGNVDQGDLPSVLINLVRSATGPIVTPPPSLNQPARRQTNKGGALKARILGLMSDKRERKSEAIISLLRAKSPTSVYSVLTELVSEGHLIKTRFAHYRLKLRSQ